MATLNTAGTLVTVSVPSLDGSLITQIEDGQSCTVNLTSEGYSGATLGTLSRSIPCEFESASGASPASVVLRVSEPIYVDDTSVTLTCTAGAFDDGTTTSAAITAESVTNSSTLVYPKCLGQIAGVLNSSNELLVEYSALSGTVTAEAIGFGHFALDGSLASVKFDLDDGVTTLTDTVTAMSRSSYNPSTFYSAIQTAGMIDEDPFTANSGGSGIFKTDFDMSLLNDGEVTLTATFYPKVGDASSVRTVTWTLWNDNGATLTQNTLYIDSRSTGTLSGVTGTFTVGEKITGGTSGAIGRIRSISGSTINFSHMSAVVAWSASETITGADSGATATMSSVSHNGNNANAGTSSGSPKRTLAGSVPTGSTSTQYTIYLMGDTTDKSFYSIGRSTTGAVLATWHRITPDAGLDETDITVLGREGAQFNDSRDKRLMLDGVTVLCDTAATFIQGDNSRDGAIWIRRCDVNGSGRDGASFSWLFDEFFEAGGGYYTGSKLRNLDSAGIDEATLARDLEINAVNEDLIRSCLLCMEVYGNDNDSPDVASHEDGIQFSDTSDSNRIYYNIAMTDVTISQLFLSDDVHTAGLVNIVAVTSDYTGGFSQYGNTSSAHIVKDFIIAHITFVNVVLEHRFQASSTDENAFLRYSVMQDFNGYDLTNGYLTNHLTNSSDDVLGVTSALNDNPYVNGISPDTNDNASARDFRPNSTNLTSRIASGERFTMYDTFGYAVPDDGTASIGALQAAVVVNGGGTGDATVQPVVSGFVLSMVSSTLQ